MYTSPMNPMVASKDLNPWKVSSGLDSLVLGEAQILAQVPVEFWVVKHHPWCVLVPSFDWRNRVFTNGKIGEMDPIWHEQIFWMVFETTN